MTAGNHLDEVKALSHIELEVSFVHTSVKKAKVLSCHTLDINWMLPSLILDGRVRVNLENFCRVEGFTAQQ